MLPKNQLTDGPCTLDGNLVDEHIPRKSFMAHNFCCDGTPVKSFMAYNFCCDSTSTLKKLTVLLGWLIALFGYFGLNICKLMQN